MCAWYQCVPVTSAVHSYVLVWPGSIIGWVTPGTPSWSFGSSMPCQCTDVPSGRSFFTMKRTRSRSLMRTTGPGTMPLKVHASRKCPFVTSHFFRYMCRLKTLTPSTTLYGASCVPSPRSRADPSLPGSAGKASGGSAGKPDEGDGLGDGLGLVDGLGDGAVEPPPPTVTVPSM